MELKQYLFKKKAPKQLVENIWDTRVRDLYAYLQAPNNKVAPIWCHKGSILQMIIQYPWCTILRPYFSECMLLSHATSLRAPSFRLIRILQHFNNKANSPVLFDKCSTFNSSVCGCMLIPRISNGKCSIYKRMQTEEAMCPVLKFTELIKYYFAYMVQILSF